VEKRQNNLEKMVLLYLGTFEAIYIAKITKKGEGK
jgi:hypothetical protein